MDIPQKIDMILEKRKELLPRIEEALERAEKARNVVERLDTYRAMQSDMPELAAKLAGIDSRPFFEQQSKAVQQLEQLHNRFARDEIKICFVGRARQGKSLVLQRISGLEGDVIPSSDGSHCTGTRSIISNRPNAETTAEIDFFSEQEYVNIVNSYLKEIYKGNVPLISSAAGICGLDLKSLKDQVSFDQLTRWDRLEKLVKHASEFQGRFGTRITVSKAEIESYVAQYSHKDKNIQYYTYLGVKQANILAPFPLAQCGKIVLVDTIGTGDVALGVEDEMLATVKDSDAIILILRPDAMANIVYSEDYETATSIARTVTPEYTEKMLFWLLNRVEQGNGKNSDRIPAVMKQINDQNLPIAQCLNVNCWEQDDVEQNLLLPVLEQMSANLSSIDQMVIERTNQQLEAMELAYHLISSRVERALGSSVNPNERFKFRPTIRSTIAKMTDGLRGLTTEYRENIDIPCEVLKTAADEKLKHVVVNVPTYEYIMNYLNDGRLVKHDVLKLLATELRLQIINDFLELNCVLHDVVQEMKRRVVRICVECGKLERVVNTECEKPDVWLSTMQKKLDTIQYPLICQALEPFRKFDLSMENFLIYKVRCCLDAIDWSLMKQPPQLANDEKDALAKEIDDVLRYSLENVHKGIKRELEDFYTFPNTAMFAALRDFYDRVTFSSNGNGSVLDQWEDLYESKIPLIWPEEHKAFIAAAGQAEEWRVITEDIHACDADGYFLI